MELNSEFENNGYIIVENFIDVEKVSKIKNELLVAIESERKNLGHTLESSRIDSGMVHNCFLYGEEMLKLLNYDKLRLMTDQLLCKHAIVYAYQSSSAPPLDTNYGGRIHVDSPRFIPDYPTNLGFILALDPFTDQNGATEVLPGSHKLSQQPTEEFFSKNKKSLICEKGTAIFFAARLWHRTGLNRSTKWRNAITINFCRPFMRSRFDFPRLATESNLAINPNSEIAKYLGWNVRMPTNLSEFYLPPESRLYKPNQE